MAIKNISKGFHSQETLHLKARENASEVNIEALGSNADISINVIPKALGSINLDGVVINDNTIYANTLQVNTQNVITHSFTQGISGKYFFVNALETGNGVGGNGKAGLSVERGVDVNQYILFDEIDNTWKLGTLDALNQILTVAGTINNVSPNRLYFTGNTTNFLTSSDLTFDNNTSILSLTGDFNKNGDIVKNKQENDLLYASLINDQEIHGNTTFSQNVSISGDLSSNVATFLDAMYVTGNSIFNVNEFSINTTESISTSGMSGTPSGANISISGVNISISGATNFKNDVTFNNDIIVEGNAFKMGGGTFSSISDKRLKENIKPIGNAIDKLSKLKGVEFNWKKGINNGSKETGFVAQDIEKVFPEFIINSGTNNDTKKYIPEGDQKNISFTNSIFAYLVESIKELKKENEQIKDKLIFLEKQINSN